jgi:hypothetical protein
MPAPFYGAIKGTTAGTPGTGAFTPNAASTGFSPWSDVPTGWMGRVRFEDGSAWAVAYCYWNGTTLSRSANQLVKSSTGSPLSLTSSATAAMVIDPNEVMPHLGGTRWMHWSPSNTGNTMTGVGGSPTLVVTGTAGSNTLATTNYQTEQIRNNIASATTANAQQGYSHATAQAVVSTAAGRGGFELSCRFGPSVLPTGPRLFMGMSTVTFVGQTIEPSARVGSYVIFGKDSTDTNIQFITNDGTTTGTKIDTGIVLATGGWYEMTVWTEPGSNKCYGLLMRLDHGDIWYGSTTTDVPLNGSLMLPMLLGGLNGTNTGTAFTMHYGSITLRVGS